MSAVCGRWALESTDSATDSRARCLLAAPVAGFGAESRETLLQIGEPVMNRDNAIEETNARDVSGNLDQRRRRLMRGVASAAPVVLTLRSGALAAASCTGAIVITTVDNSGKLANTTGVQVGQVCVVEPITASCPSGSAPKISGGTYAGTVSQQGSNLRCEQASNRVVAILSSASASSLGIGGTG